MKKVEFIANHKDNMHCAMAVFRMVHRYYFGSDLGWRAIDDIAYTIKGKGSWTFMMELDFAKKGLDILNIEPVDYNKLYKEGVNYLKEVEGEKVAKYYLEKTNIASVVKYIPEYTKVVKHETRKTQVSEVIDFLKKGYLVVAEVDSSVLFNYKGFELHLILLFGFEGKNILANDPGLPPVPNRKISIPQFKKCFEYRGASQATVVFKGMKKV